MERNGVKSSGKHDHIGKPRYPVKRRGVMDPGPIYLLFEFRKADAETGEGLDGTHFRMVDQYGKSSTAVSEGGGRVRFYIMPAVTYKLTETKAPLGYLPDNNVYIVQISKYGETVINSRFAQRFTLKGEMRKVFADFFFTNRDEDGPIEGAVFELIKDGEAIAASTSLHSGLVLFESLSPGTYLLEEAVYPSGYAPEPEIWEVIVARDGRITVNGVPSADFAVVSRKGTSLDGALAIKSKGAPQNLR